jgi:hypothetical protein
MTAWIVLAAALGAVAVSGYLLTVTGALTLDVGVGRRLRPLGPRTLSIAAPRQLVFDEIAVAYLSVNPPRALRGKVSVLERGTDIVVAAHRTPFRPFTAVTVESVRFERPERVSFRLLRGPVPFVRERFGLAEREGKTELVYSGELGTDFWWLGAAWGIAVAAVWVRTVERSLAELKESAERKARRT